MKNDNTENTFATFQLTCLICEAFLTDLGADAKV